MVGKGHKGLVNIFCVSFGFTNKHQFESGKFTKRDKPQRVRFSLPTTYIKGEDCEDRRCNKRME